MNARKEKLSFCEGMTCGHPDRLADLICDAILDQYLKLDPEAHVGIEAILSKDLICITGEVESSSTLDIAQIVRETLSKTIPRTLEFFPEINAIPIQVSLHHQSEELAKVRDLTQDQSIIIGYATNETAQKMPYSLMVVRTLLNYIEKLKETGLLPFLAEDGKVLVICDQASKLPVKILMSYQHQLSVKVEEVRTILSPFIKEWTKSPCEIVINPMGEFVHGSILADTGVSGRKIIFESYGSDIPHGGGAMSGKDPYKVDRWGAILARKMALAALKQFDLPEILIKLAFSPGSKTLFGISLDSHQIASKSVEEEIKRFLIKQFPLDVKSAVQEFKLDKPIYYEMTKNGCFGNIL